MAHPLVKHVMRDEYDVYVGRWNPKIPHESKSIWHNPFREGTREENIQKFIDYLADNEYLLSQIHTLRGKRLACWCSPRDYCRVSHQHVNSQGHIYLYEENMDKRAS